MTAPDGTFSIRIPSEEVMLEVSCLGYVTQTVRVPAGQRTVSVTLEEDTMLLEETVVVGYGVQKKVNLTLEVDALLRKDRRRPVQAAVADHIDERVRQGDEPQELVVEDVVEEDFLRGDGRLVLLGVVLGIVVAPLFHGREAAGLRRVAQQDESQEGDEQGDGRREGEGADEEVQFRVGM